MPGVVQGRPGVNYENRTDLQTGDRAYGDGTNKASTQRASSAAATQNSVRPDEVIQPGQLTGLSEPTQRPNEPITAGLPTGAGPGPEALGQLPTRGASDQLFELRSLYGLFPNEDLRRLIQSAEENL